MGLNEGMRTELLNWAYLGEVFSSRMQGIAFDNPKRNGEYRLIRKLRNVIAVALDGSAHPGAWGTRVLSDAGSTVKIVCEEPDPWNAAVLRARFEGYSNVSVHEVRWEVARGPAPLYQARDMDQGRATSAKRIRTPDSQLE